MRQTVLGILVALTVLFTSSVRATEHQQLTGEQELFTSAIEVLTPQEIDQILIEVQDFQLRNPGVSEKDVDRLVATLVTQQVRKPIRRIDGASTLPEYYDKLNRLEKRVCVTNLLKCAKVLSAGSKALSTAPTYFRDGCEDGRCDAFRHAYWNALMVRRTDYQYASDFAAAHESEGDPYALNRRMDYANNITGQSIGQSYSSSKYTDTKVEEVVKSYVLQGKLLIIKDGKLTKSNK